MQNPEDVQLAATALKKRLPRDFSANGGAGVILGTGLSEAAGAIGEPLARVPFSELPGFPEAGIQWREGAFIACLSGEMPVLIQLGRSHLYEGKTPVQICLGVRVMAELGVKTLVITNAAGALNPLFTVPGLMAICDIINHTGASPLQGANCDAWGERFPDMSEPLDKNLISLLAETALDQRVYLEKGVYIGVHGPEMETPAETRAYRQWGADAIGMSSVLEIIAARHRGLKCLGISCLTNKNLPDCMAPAPLDAVIAAADTLAPKLGALIAGFLAKLSASQR